MGRWPFAAPPERATMAQVLFYQEALRQLEDLTKKPAAAPKRLKGEAWQELKRKAGN